MRYLYIFLIFVTLPAISLSQSDWATYQDSMANQTGLRYDVRQHPWMLKVDLLRPIFTIPSIQLSVSYRPSLQFGFESEFNYYLKSNIEPSISYFDALQANLSTSKASFFVSGIGKVYLGDRKIYYFGPRLAIARISRNLSRKVCIESETTTSGDICRCNKYANKTLETSKIHFLPGIRQGLDFPITNRLRFDVYLDISWPSQKKTIYPELEHDQSCALPIKNTWQPLVKAPDTDGAFIDLSKSTRRSIISFSIKLGYAF